MPCKETLTIDINFDCKGLPLTRYEEGKDLQPLEEEKGTFKVINTL